MHQTSLAWSLVVPVKVLARAKSRLTGLAQPGRAELVLAMAVDTVSAAMACPETGAVIVVTGDARVRSELSGVGAVVVDDEPAAGLNPALTFGAAVAEQRWPRCGRAALAADLPSLRPGELASALRSAAVLGEAFLPDASGDGTTLYAAAPGVPFRPAFGPSSRRRHRTAGVAEIGGSGLDGLRCDVDTITDLRRALELGPGPRTASVLQVDAR
jgi:2-phospho-L-lactate guanylyltransferase